MIQYLAQLGLVAMFTVSGGLAIMSHGRQHPTTRFNCFPVLGLLFIEMALVALSLGYGS